MSRIPHLMSRIPLHGFWEEQRGRHIMAEALSPPPFRYAATLGVAQLLSSHTTGGGHSINQPPPNYQLTNY